MEKKTPRILMIEMQGAGYIYVSIFYLNLSADLRRRSSALMRLKARISDNRAIKGAQTSDDQLTAPLSTPVYAYTAPVTITAIRKRISIVHNLFWRERFLNIKILISGIRQLRREITKNPQVCMRNPVGAPLVGIPS